MIKGGFLVSHTGTFTYNHDEQKKPLSLLDRVVLLYRTDQARRGDRT